MVPWVCERATAGRARLSYSSRAYSLRIGRNVSADADGASPGGGAMVGRVPDHRRGPGMCDGHTVVLASTAPASGVEEIWALVAAGEAARAAPRMPGSQRERVRVWSADCCARPTLSNSSSESTSSDMAEWTKSSAKPNRSASWNASSSRSVICILPGGDLATETIDGGTRPVPLVLPSPGLYRMRWQWKFNCARGPFTSPIGPLTTLQIPDGQGAELEGKDQYCLVRIWRIAEHAEV